jgi:hypothetical protein
MENFSAGKKNFTEKVLNRIKNWPFGLRQKFDEVISEPTVKQLYTPLIFFILLFLGWFGLSYLFFRQDVPFNNEIDSRFWGILAQMIDPGNLHMAGTQGAESIFWGLRLFVFLVTFSGTVAVSGLLISTLVNIIERRVIQIREGHVNYVYKNHIIIIGFDYVAFGLIKQLFLNDDYKDSKVVIHSTQNAHLLRQKLIAQFDVPEERRLVILHGNRDSREEMERLHLKNAKEIFILGEPDEKDHDSKNIECTNIISSLLKGKPCTTKDCHVMLEYQTTYSLFQFSDFGKNKETKINILPFNFCENWAQIVFVKGKYSPASSLGSPIMYKMLDYNAIDEDSDLSVHMVIVGMTRMGVALGVETARLAHFANHKKVKTRITFVDPNANEERDFFASRYPKFYDAVDVYWEDITNNKSNNRKEFKVGELPFIDVELEFIKGSIEMPGVRKRLTEWALEDNKLLTLAICLDNPSVSLAAGIYLPEELYEKDIPILIQQNVSYSILSLLSEDKITERKYKNVRPFGMTDDCIGLDPFLFKIAKAINFYYVRNSAFQDSHSLKDYENEINDCWKELTESNKWSNLYYAESFETKIRAVIKSGEVFTLEKLNQNNELVSKMEHARWNTERLLAGFRQATKDEIIESNRTADDIMVALHKSKMDYDDITVQEIKQIHIAFVKHLKSRMKHPCIVPWDQLSEYYKEIDRKLSKALSKILRDL